MIEPGGGSRRRLFTDGGDLDGDGWCDGIERANGWNEIDPCSPVVTDTDSDGWCDMEELLSGWDPEDPCSPNATDTDGDGLCDVFEELNGSSPFSAESVLGLDGLETEAISVAWIGSGFSVECDGCLPARRLLDSPAARSSRAASRPSTA